MWLLFFVFFVSSLNATNLPQLFEKKYPDQPSIEHIAPFQKKQWDDLSNLYLSFLNHNLNIEERKIPKIFHQIWLGSKFPEKYQSYRQSFIEKHPDWTFILWTEKEIALLELEKKELYDLSTNYGEKSDIARYEILYQFGGIYIDCDLKCLQPLDIFSEKTNFFAGVSHDYFGSPLINNAIIGSSPHHPVLKKCIDLITKVRSSDQPVTKIIGTTGPKILTKAFFAILPDLNIPMVILPYTYFYPFPSHHRTSLCKDIDWIKEESFTIHYWDMSWASDFVLKEIF